MSYYSQDVIAHARQMDLLSYLRMFEPDNLVRLSNGNYCTKEHDSLKISNGKWYWFSRGIGGASALDYLVKVREMSFTRAVETNEGIRNYKAPDYVPEKEDKPREFRMPDLMKYPENAKQYLLNRGIHPSVIDYCLCRSLLFESLKYHNVILVGYDKDGIARYATLRGTKANYKGEVPGSDKHFAFSISENPNASHIHLFESAIDLLSYLSLELYQGRDWTDDCYLSLGGVYQTKRKDVMPYALNQYLSDHLNITTIHLHLDNDDAGRNATAGIIAGLSGKYSVLDEPPLHICKDVNDQLKMEIQNMKKEEINYEESTNHGSSAEYAASDRLRSDEYAR